MEGAATQKKTFWNKTRLGQVAAEIDRDLLLYPKNKKDQLSYMLQQIKALEKTSDELSNIKRFFYCNSVLEFYERFGGLKDWQVNSVFEVAFTLLKCQGITPKGSRLGYLYADLFQMRSQIYRKLGRPWAAAWEQQMSGLLVKRTGHVAKGRQYKLLARRALRLGNNQLAMQLYGKAERYEMSAEEAIKLSMEKIHVLRLSGKEQDCLKLISEMLASETLTPDDVKKLEWEKSCINFKESQCLSELLKSVSCRGSHYEPAYFLEAYLWTRATTSQRWLTRIAKVDSKARSEGLQVHKQGFAYQCAAVFEHCYDDEVPLQFRLQRLGDLLSDKSKILAVHIELLVLSAATVWLSRVRAYDFAKFTLAEYEALSSRLTNGQSKDVLGTLPEIAKKSWYAS